jgi:hypothetical protein
MVGPPPRPTIAQAAQRAGRGRKRSSAALVGRLIRRFPFHRSEVSKRFRDPVTETPEASHGVGCSAEYCEWHSSRLVGLPTPRLELAVFQQPRAGLPAPSSPGPLRERVHPLLSFSPPSECAAASTLSDARRRQTPVLGFVPHRDTSPQSPLMGRAPKPDHPVPPSAFLTPSTACSSACLAGLFHPAATSRVHTPGVSFHRPADPPHRRAVPSCRWLQAPTAAETTAPASCNSPPGR